MRGPRLMNGYLGNPKASAASFIDGWLKTGDIGTVDKQGRIFIVDRQKVSPLWPNFLCVSRIGTKSICQDLIKGKPFSSPAP